MSEHGITADDDAATALGKLDHGKLTRLESTVVGAFMRCASVTRAMAAWCDCAPERLRAAGFTVDVEGVRFSKLAAEELRGHAARIERSALKLLGIW